jgi:hypothetical protein
MNLDAIEKFKLIYAENSAIAKTRGRITEADTRANILDRILHEVLEWPRSEVDREPHVNQGYIDFLVKHGRPIFVLEAKAEGETFSLPYRKAVRRKINVKNLFSMDPKIKAAMIQAQRYCVDTGTRFAVVSNGYSFIIFRAIIEGYSWFQGSSVVFYDYNDINNDFASFWNLLSYESVIDGNLEDAFRYFTPSTRNFYKPIEVRADSDATYGRNPYASTLRPFIDKFFGDIAAQDTIELLKHCYVYSQSIQYIDKDLHLILQDQIPIFANGAESVETSSSDESGAFGSHVRSKLASGTSSRSVTILMGGIGSGKTTYCRRFFRVVAPELIAPDGPATLCYLNFLGAPDDSRVITTYTWHILSETIKHAHPEILERETLSEIFSSELSLLRTLYTTSHDLERKIADTLYVSLGNDELFSEKSLLYFVSQGKTPLLVFDNVDQLGIEVQTQVFTLCQRIMNRGCCFSILALREESFSTAIMQKHMTAYSIHPYHLSSPRFKNLLGLRIDFAVQEAAAICQKKSATPEDKVYGRIVGLFTLLRESILGRNYNIIRLVESIAYGNMRLALRLFNSFVTSGATDINKIIDHYSQGKGYTVPFHEFTKSIMLGEYRFYKESRSPIVNLLNVARCNNSSHFTALRILKYLSAYADTSNINSGFVNLHALISDIADIFGNDDDCRETILKMIALEKQLVELDTRRSDSIEGASEIRISTSGVYYLDYLIKSFAYIDLIWHDTPFAERATSENLASKILLTDMNDRFARVGLFLDYLTQQEKNELMEHNLKDNNGAFWGPFMPQIVDQIEKEKVVIKKKLRMTS